MSDCYCSKKSVALGNNLATLRKARGMSISELAGILQISVNSLENLEQGIVEKDIDIKIIFITSTFFNISPYDLFK